MLGGQKVRRTVAQLDPSEDWGGTKLHHFVPKVAGIVDDVRKQLEQLAAQLDVEGVAQTPAMANARDLLDGTLDFLVQHDPTGGRQTYLRWMVKQVLAGGTRIADSVREVAAMFWLNKERLPADRRDIYQYPDLASAYTEVRALGPSRSQKKRQGSEKIYQKGPVTIFRVFDEDAACQIGAGTTWCIAATESENFFDHYEQQYDTYILVGDRGKWAVHTDKGTKKIEILTPQDNGEFHDDQIDNLLRFNIDSRDRYNEEEYEGYVGWVASALSEAGFTWPAEPDVEVFAVQVEDRFHPWRVFDSEDEFQEYLNKLDELNDFEPYRARLVRGTMTHREYNQLEDSRSEGKTTSSGDLGLLTTHSDEWVEMNEPEPDEDNQRVAKTVRPTEAAPGVFYHGTSMEALSSILRDGLRPDSGAQFAPAVKNDPQLHPRPAVYLTTWFEQAIRYAHGLSFDNVPVVIEVELDPTKVQPDLMDDPRRMSWPSMFFEKPKPMMRGQIQPTQVLFEGSIPPSAIRAVYLPSKSGEQYDVPALGGETIEAYNQLRDLYAMLKDVLEGGSWDPQVAESAEQALNDLDIDIGVLDDVLTTASSLYNWSDDELTFDDENEEQAWFDELSEVVQLLREKLFTNKGVGYPVMSSSLRFERLTPAEALARSS